MLEARRTRSSSLKLAGLMVVFLAFAVAVLLNEDVLAGDGARSIDHRPTQIVVACLAIVLVARMLPMALLDLYDARPAVRLDADGGQIRTFIHRRTFRWNDVVAVEGGPKRVKIRLTHARPIQLAGNFEPHDLLTIHAHALAHWTSTTRT